MALYYYINTGHRVGLDRLRRSAPIINALEDEGIEVRMLTNDFRAGEYAKEHFGIRRYVSVDVVRNIANIATPADSIVFDSAEESRRIWEDMANYFRTFIRISDNPNDTPLSKEILISSMKSVDGAPLADVVDRRYFDQMEHSDEMIYFWGDADYDRRLLSLSEVFRGLDIALLEGYYFFMQYSDELAVNFKKAIDGEEYDNALKSAGKFFTSSPQSALEALAAGSSPVYIKKPDASDVWDEKMRGYNIPIIENFEKNSIEKMANETVDTYDRKKLKKDAANTISRYILHKMAGV